MRFRRNKNKVKIIIDFDKETEEIKIEARPETSRPTEIIQIFMFAIRVINQTLQMEIQKQTKGKKEKPKKLGYIG